MNATETTTGQCSRQQAIDAPAPPRRAGTRGGARSATPLGELCDHILTAGHDRLKDKLPRIRLTLLKVTDAHASRHPELHRVLAAFARFADDLTLHLSEEDHGLFPLVGRLEAGAATARDVRGRIEALGAAHERVATALDELRSLTGGFAVPEDACDAYRALMGDLRDLDDLVRLTVCEEDELLFPEVARLVNRPPEPLGV